MLWELRSRSTRPGIHFSGMRIAPIVPPITAIRIMAVHCPIYDPCIGWYIIIMEPDGPKKQLIVSPLYYYHSMGVSPPIGAVFSEEDYEEFEYDKNVDYNEFEDSVDQYPSLPQNSPSLPSAPGINTSYDSVIVNPIPSTSSAAIESLPSTSYMTLYYALSSASSSVHAPTSPYNYSTIPTVVHNSAIHLPAPKNISYSTSKLNDYPSLPSPHNSQYTVLSPHISFADPQVMSSVYGASYIV